MIHALIAALVISQPPHTPLDGFRANFRAVHAELDFSHVAGLLQGPGRRVWEEKDPGFTPKWDTERVGHWACDGEAEYYRFSSASSILEAVKKAKVRHEAGKTYFSMFSVPKTEVIWDGTYFIGHYQDQVATDPKASWAWTSLMARRPKGSIGVLQHARGPFYWGFVSPFPYGIKLSFPDIEPTHHRSERGGRPVEVETYQREISQTSWERLDVAYDPSIGYLPRHVQLVVFGTPRSVLVREMFLVDARRCEAGGFVPTEWYTAGSYPAHANEQAIHSVDGAAIELDGELHATHFLATSFASRSTPVALQDLADVNSIDCVGGRVPLKSQQASLGVSDVKSIAGERLTTPLARIGPTPDYAEMHDYDAVPSRRRWPYVVGCFLVVVVAVLLFRRRRYPT